MKSLVLMHRGIEEQFMGCADFLNPSKHTLKVVYIVCGQTFMGCSVAWSTWNMGSAVGCTFSW